MQLIVSIYNSTIGFLDEICSLVDKMVLSVKEIKEESTDTVSPEEMIEAAMERLKEENRKLKKLQYPEKIIRNTKKSCYLCPKCREDITEQILSKKRPKYCFSCGQRIYMEGKTT